MLPDLALLLTLISSNYPVSNIFNGSNGVRAIEVLLYIVWLRSVELSEELDKQLSLAYTLFIFHAADSVDTDLGE